MDGDNGRILQLDIDNNNVVRFITKQEIVTIPVFYADRTFQMESFIKQQMMWSLKSSV